MIKKHELENNYNILNFYFSKTEVGKKVFYDKDILTLLKSILYCNKEKIIVSNSRIFKKLARQFRIICVDYTQSLNEVQRILAFRDSLFLLAKKEIPVFFYNRVGDCENESWYDENALIRVKENRSFPVMYQNIDNYEKDFKELFGEKYSKQYIEEIGKIPQVIRVDNDFCHEDLQSNYVNVVHGIRVTEFQTNKAKRKIHIYGRCGVFGYAVEDKDTMPSQLQKMLIEKGYEEFNVINHGLWGAEDLMIDNNFFFDVQNFQKGDIVCFYRKQFPPEIMRLFNEYGLWYKDVTPEWYNFSESKWCFYDKPGHMNAIGYKHVAEIIFNDLIEKEFKPKTVAFEKLPATGIQDLHNYILKHENVNFEKSIKDYLEKITKLQCINKNQNNGAIVMNCNPFTLGHQYLIEYASDKVDILFIFVVEENKSYFEYEDRFRMVQEGTKNIKNVVVVPSGKFIISSYTFPEYFMKDYVKEKDFDVSNDVNIFCKYIAPTLCIKKRFVGEEPFDPVTYNYNETMKQLFPKYGMELVEIPRKAISHTNIINATEVRKMLENKSYDNLLKYIPITTYNILKEKYIK